MNTFACPDCGINFEEISPRDVLPSTVPTEHAPSAMAPGSKLEIDPDLVVPYPERSINEGAIMPE